MKMKIDSHDLGGIGEAFAKIIIGGELTPHKESYDIEAWDGVIEVKMSRAWKRRTNGGGTIGWKKGEFAIKPDQHNELRKSSKPQYYILILWDSHIGKVHYRVFPSTYFDDLVERHGDKDQLKFQWNHFFSEIEVSEKPEFIEGGEDV